MTAPPLKIRLTDALKDALCAQDRPRLMILHLALAALQRAEIDERAAVSDACLVQIFDKMIKQRRASWRLFGDTGRQDLADVVAAEIRVLQDFMPTPLSESEIGHLIDQAILDSGAQGLPDMAKAMALLRPLTQDRADMTLISQRLKASLSS